MYGSFIVVSDISVQARLCVCVCVRACVWCVCVYVLVVVMLVGRSWQGVEETDLCNCFIFHSLMILFSLLAHSPSWLQILSSSLTQWMRGFQVLLNDQHLVEGRVSCCVVVAVVIFLMITTLLGLCNPKKCILQSMILLLLFF